MCQAVLLNYHPPNSSENLFELVKHYFMQGFLYKEMVALLFSRHAIRMSLTSLKRILSTLQLRRRYIEYSPIEHVISAILGELSGSGQCIGYRAMWRRLVRDHNIKVKRSTVQDLMLIIDPEGVAIRKAHRLKRRMYVANGPNFIWHVDGYDKLKPYGFAIHGCIDGYSRRILWLEVSSSNNNPSVIASYYLETLKRTGRAPRLLRCDCGTENSYLKFLQCFLRYQDTDSMAREKSFMKGKSTSNQRIERFWQTLRHQGVDWWISLFKDLRDSNLFDSTNSILKECLKFCFMKDLQAELDRIAIHWNIHATRKQRAIEADCGRPYVMYFSPHFYGRRDYGSPVNMQDVSICQNLYSSSPEKCSPEFIELALLLLPELTVPTNPTASLDLYFQLYDLLKSRI